MHRLETKKYNSFSEKIATANQAQTEALDRIESWMNHQQKCRQVCYDCGLVKEVAETGGGTFRYAYSQRGDVSQICDPNGCQTSFEYDEQRRLIEVHHPDKTRTCYTYGENDRLCQINDRGVISHFDFDPKGRLTTARIGNSGASVYRYDEHGRIVVARTPEVYTKQEYDAEGRVNKISQSIMGLTIRLTLEYDDAGRLKNMFLPGSSAPVQYQWDEKGRPQTVVIKNTPIAQYEYLEKQKKSRVHLANHIVEESSADPIDRRTVARQVKNKNNHILFQRHYTYNAIGQIINDGLCDYNYDILGRLVDVHEQQQQSHWSFSYDAVDNRTSATDATGAYRYKYDVKNQLLQIQGDDGVHVTIDYNGHGQPVRIKRGVECWTYRYDDAGQLVRASKNGEIIGKFLYDHKGRLVLAHYPHRTERYLYGPADELLAVTNEFGEPLRLYIRTPLGLLGEIHGSVDSGVLFFRHQDEHGSCYLVTDTSGKTVAEFTYSPFGVPSLSTSDFAPIYKGRFWHPELMLYDFGARWYDPIHGRFLTPDSYTGRPDDIRIVNPFGPASRQAAARAHILTDWQRQPRVQNRYAFCSNDPVNNVDPNGHWSFGGVLLSILGAIWTLPNTLIGLIIEITCLVGEVIRWLVWLVTFGNVSWATPGFDVAASGRLNAFALVFEGGWFGSLPFFAGITFGNVFFVNGDWRSNAYLSGSGSVSPSSYGGRVSIPRNKALYEHELRHTNQYGWFGPFFLFGLPIWGVYIWDVIFNGYYNAWLEQDARAHGGI
ncbi:RHS repeat protein [candidate division KSB1 bacterium]|nr:RHS repeat protein [candidate division KSB1 bacterium]RQW00098.1 MAG: RHS repeat protein [candidate division KSB1 bacterium]